VNHVGIQIAIHGRVVRPGMRFQHRNWLVALPGGGVRPDTCTVTAVRRGIVHYRNEAGFERASYPSEFVADVGRWLPEAA
jgi:hypothetical protein